VEPTAREIENVRRALRHPRADPIAWSAVTAGGYTPAHRWVVTLDDGRTVFAKVATDEMTASWLRDEHVVYSVLRGASFMPGYVGFSDDGDNPVLVLEDLSAAYWPPPWTTPRIEGLLAALGEMWSTPPPERTARADDDAFLHFDVRSDNVCFRPGGDAVLVDWNLTAVGNPQIDVVFWLPSLAAEGGPAPEVVLPDAQPGLVSACASFFCARAGRPPIPTAPRVREVQLVQARTALPWAARVIGLPQPL
jgi:hypothetical protein